MTEPSGPAWCQRFPTSKNVLALKEPFRGDVTRYLNMLDAAGAAVDIAATLRPKERAYLMHWAWVIAHGERAPSGIPTMAGVDIDWNHGWDRLAAIAAATKMCAVYGLRYKPALTSRHCDGLAIDMSITWADQTITVHTAAGSPVTIRTKPHDGTNPELAAIGATYGVHKLVTDVPHWSADGR